MNGGGRLSSGRFTSGGNIHLNRLNAIGRTFHEPLALLLLEIAPSLGRFELVVLIVTPRPPLRCVSLTMDIEI